MSFIQSILKRVGFVPGNELTKLQSRFDKLRNHQRKYEAASTGRLTADWVTSQTSADAEIFRDYRRCVDRSRDLEQNNDYIRNYFRVQENNVLGHTGIGLQMKVNDAFDKQDSVANKKIEDAWWAWGKKANCTVTGDMDWVGVQRMALRSVARDGNVFIRRLKNFGNPFGFALQLFESDYLDINYNASLPGGNIVRMGVEFDQYRRRVAYYFFTKHPGDIGIVGQNSQHRTRYAASEITHLFARERIGQTIGMPWIVSSIKALNMLAGYEEAELVAARVGASKMGFIENATPEDWPGPRDGGKNVTDAEPGTFENLDPGQRFVPWDPQHPNQAYGAFVSGQLHRIGAGVGLSYHTLSGDLTQVNYSSARIGRMEDLETYKMIQGWLISDLITDVFTDFLESALLTQQIKLPAAGFNKFNAPDWKPRRWPYVDPEKDIAAAKAAIRIGITSQRAVIAEGGGDINETFADQEADQKLAEEKGLEFPDLESDIPPVPEAQSQQEPATGPRSGVILVKE